ncbi:ketopantoate reductase family protein [Vreelandella hamiltonii]|jgi:2-dehydropantoate 2-reductase|uniref:2-dehydropantoate 2-reductase n=2 Tax=Halomonadaceae TaxID=28256 RepID=A0A8H9I3J4_9GAMM|nr:MULTISPECIES: 2-dehydropantoate 2-reductase [Halomonas]ATH77344.1 2-dehydropantoate 2-reductase [Halomonas hydrothermalis]GGW27881.1 2-dehydropantoate 2-reductase [Halomonas hamiltonii]GGW53693.1 2-dehydropantoate 2-reductase [Halomonas johnsoniae]
MLASIAAPRIAIVGAGAIGTTLAARLAVAGYSVSVLARGETLASIKRQGVCLIDGQEQHTANVPVSDKCSELGEQDIVLLCTKAHSLPSLLPQLKPLFGQHTCLVPMVNGTPWWLLMDAVEPRSVKQFHIEAVDPGGKLVDCLPASAIVGCVVYITAQLKAPGIACSNTPLRLVVGEVGTPSTFTYSRLSVLIEVLESAGIDTRYAQRIRDAVWSKIAANLTSNPLSVITGTTLAQLYSHPSLQRVVGQLFGETRLTAEAYGSQLEMTLQQLVELGESMGAVSTSMLQDHRQGRALELAAIVEGVIELADRKGIPVPTIKSILHLTRYFEDSGLHHPYACDGKEKC